MKNVAQVVGVLMVVALVASCAPKASVTPVPGNVRLAVAGVFQPAHGWELMAGHLPEDMTALPPEALGFMDSELAAQLAGRKHAAPFIAPGVVRQCQEILWGQQRRSRPSAFSFWMEVAKCVPADYILVPYLFQWQERQGNDWSVNQPAGVVFDLYLIDVKNESVRRAHYEEVQHSLSENLLDAGTFYKRKGKWVTAEQMAREGLATCLEELGL
ncbi:hypothetical protein [Desulfoplanes formicivorans]|uniref:Lipoprotein n=1 Tax=Desulfoplanes formicivorans TaxID=1592317 RepID=A0A194AK58_9BACT|nr:hypothetical protein [Desulfoplanes formicivorans]GAU09698.1 hypothetical protein DPF_2429 [Desulfoplanes formicivorans]